MKHKQMTKQIIIVLLAGGFTLATGLKAAEPPDPVPASPPPGEAQPPALDTQKPRRAELAREYSDAGYMSATHILGREVRNDAGEHLGTVQDFIVNLDSDTARFAIIKSGGTLGIGGTRVAVPLKDLKWSADTKEFSLTATKEQIQSASAIPVGGWAFAVNQEWTSKVDRFYGDPGKFDLSELGRPALTEPDASREFVRDALQPQPAIGPQHQWPAADPEAKTLRSKVADGDLLAKVNQIIGQSANPAAGGHVQATVEKGVVTLKGRVADAAQKLNLETRIKGLNGVRSLIDDQLSASIE
jgi:sporulation protein YlmC with PRC-barrel domain